MAKLSLINRELKREATVAKFAAKRAELKAIINDAARPMRAPSSRRFRVMRAPCACATAAASPAVRAVRSVNSVWPAA